MGAARPRRLRANRSRARRARRPFESGPRASAFTDWLTAAHVTERLIGEREPPPRPLRPCGRGSARGARGARWLCSCPAYGREASAAAAAAPRAVAPLPSGQSC